MSQRVIPPLRGGLRWYPMRALGGTVYNAGGCTILDSGGLWTVTTTAANAQPRYEWTPTVDPKGAAVFFRIRDLSSYTPDGNNRLIYIRPGIGDGAGNLRDYLEWKASGAAGHIVNPECSVDGVLGATAAGSNSIASVTSMEGYIAGSDAIVGALVGTPCALADVRMAATAPMRFCSVKSGGNSWPTSPSVMLEIKTTIGAAANKSWRFRPEYAILNLSDIIG